MSEEIQILQLGTEDWNNCYQLPENIELTFAEEFTKAPKLAYDLVFVDRSIKEEEVPALCKATKAHTLYVTDRELWNDAMQEFYARKRGKRIALEKVQEFLLKDAKNQKTFY